MSQVMQKPRSKIFLKKSAVKNFLCAIFAHFDSYQVDKEVNSCAII